MEQNKNIFVKWLCGVSKIGSNIVRKANRPQYDRIKKNDWSDQIYCVIGIFFSFLEALWLMKIKKKREHLWGTFIMVKLQ